METVDSSHRLSALRELMKKGGIEVYIVPSEDSHSSEYIAPCDARREFISGFSGSAGIAVCTLEKAALATDGRYFTQAQKQLDSNWLLLKQGLPEVPTAFEWAAKQSSGGKTVGVDPTLITASDARKLHDKIKKEGGKLLYLENLVDKVWGSERPARPNEPVIVLGQQYAGKEIKAKLEGLRKEMKSSPGFIVSMLDEIAWLFNLRGNDIPYNPVFFSYAVITHQNATLYVDESKLSNHVKTYLQESGVLIRPYGAIFDDNASLARDLDLAVSAAEPVCRSMLSSPASLSRTLDAPPSTNGEVRSTITRQKFIVSTRTSVELKRSLGGDSKVEEVRSPIGDAKAVKNETELSGMRECHIRDGAALTQYFAWLEDQLINKKASIDEVQAADKLEELRSKHKNFVGLSFDTISSTGANAAVIHYKPEPGNCSIVDPTKVYLCDSGAQYLDGTTDTTRTLHFGEPTEMERKAYTLVLKGNIALDVAVFPRGTSGFALDTLARQYLWAEGLDYRHGTGHGVGSFLNVHEGPIGIGTRIQFSEVPLAPGNVISNEPGYYEDGVFGIRIENILMVKEVETKHQFGKNQYLGFEHVTMVPYCRKLIDESLLTVKEKDWLNRYHKEIKEKTAKFLEGDEVALRWLDRETEAI